MSTKIVLLSGAIAAGLMMPVNAADETYSLSGFNEIEAEAGIDVNITVGEDFSVEADAKRGNIDRLEITQRGDRLYISRDTPRLLAAGRRDRFVVTITLPELEELDVSAGVSAEVDFNGASANSIFASSGASLEVNDLAAGSIEIATSSGASLDVTGSCTSLEISASSGASIDGRDFECDEADASARSGASISLFAGEKLIGGARGGASVSAYGDPDVVDFNTGISASLSLR